MIDIDAMVDGLVDVLKANGDIVSLTATIDTSDIDDHTKLNGIYVKVLPAPRIPTMDRIAWGVTKYVVEIHIYVIEKRLLTASSDEDVRVVIPYILDTLYSDASLNGAAGGITRIGEILDIPNELGARIYDIPIYYEYLDNILT